jgi:hypothetical protein
VASLSAWSWFDAAIGIGCGLACALLGVAARRALGPFGLRPPRGWAQALLRLPGVIVADTARVFALVINPSTSRRAGVRRTAVGRGDARADEGWQGWVGLLISVSPGAYVIDVAEDGHAALLHALGPATGAEQALRVDPEEDR